MEPARVLRAVALFCLAAVINGPTVKAGDESTFTEPTNVKDMLDLFGKLSGSNIKDQVFKKLEEQVKGYLKLDGIPGDNVKNNLEKLVEGAVKLRKSVLKGESEYGKYSGLTLTQSKTDYFVETLIHWLPKLHSELYYLYFQTTADGTFIGGSGWASEYFGSNHTNTNLHKWLTSKGFAVSGIAADGRAPNIVADTGVSFYAGGPLNYAQYGLFFLSSTWHDSNLASAVLFLQEFCGQVHNENGIFKDRLASYSHTDSDLKSVCERVRENLQPLTDDVLFALYNPKTADQADVEGEEQSQQQTNKPEPIKNPYKDKLEAGNLPKYLSWLEKTLPDITASLYVMKEDSSSWAKDILDKAESAGPFKYGFVFKDKAWDGEIYQKLAQYIDRFLGISHPPTPSGRGGGDGKPTGSRAQQPSGDGSASSASPKGAGTASGASNAPSSTMETSGPAQGTPIPKSSGSPAPNKSAPVRPEKASPATTNESDPAKHGKSSTPPAVSKGSEAKVSKDSTAKPKEPEEAQLRGEQEAQPSSFMSTSLLSCMLTCVVITVL